MKTTLEHEKEIRGITGDVTLGDIALEGTLIPMLLVDDEEELSEVIFCESISGGADYVDDMPRQLTLTRLTVDGHKYEAQYIQVGIETGAKTLSIDKNTGDINM
jgi:hypothetical protein